MTLKDLSSKIKSNPIRIDYENTSYRTTDFQDTIAASDFSSVYDMINQIVNEQNENKAKAYIETNIDLFESDMKKFFRECPEEIFPEVYKILLRADINVNSTIQEILAEDAARKYVQYKTNWNNNNWKVDYLDSMNFDLARKIFEDY